MSARTWRPITRRTPNSQTWAPNRPARFARAGFTRTIAGAARSDAPQLVADAVAAGHQVYGVRILTSTLEETYLEAVGDEVS